MKLTVAICTWNRERLLDQTLLQMRKLRIPDHIEWELLIVNNKCTDNSDHVISRHSECLPIRRLWEPAQGLSRARNTAVREATGDYILWTDDDVLVDEYWIEAYARAFKLWPEAAIFGGPIRPWFEGKPPRWLETAWPQVSNAYAVVDRSANPIAITADTLPFGANYAVKGSLHKLYLYDSALGRKGKGMLGYDETTLILGILADGMTGYWVPEAQVLHVIPRHKQNKYYLRRYFYWQGFYMGNKRQGKDSKKPYRRIMRLIAGILFNEIKYCARKMTSGPDVWIKSLIKASMLWGTLQGFLRRNYPLEPDLIHGAEKEA